MVCCRLPSPWHSSPNSAFGCAGCVRTKSSNHLTNNARQLLRIMLRHAFRNLSCPVVGSSSPFSMAFGQFCRVRAGKTWPSKPGTPAPLTEQACNFMMILFFNHSWLSFNICHRWDIVITDNVGPLSPDMVILPTGARNPGSVRGVCTICCRTCPMLRLSEATLSPQRTAAAY